MRTKTIFLSSFLGLVFLITGLLTLSYYNVSWDETIHFRRGQAYLRLFLTGEKNYDNFVGRRSYYQNDLQNADWFLRRDVGHPPLNGELAALSNYIFYQKLGILGDIESHHLFGLLVSSLLIFILVYFVGINTGLFAGLIAGLSLMFYPLFWGESKFNVKDPVETAFFSFSIFIFYWFTLSRKKSLFMGFFVIWAMAMATKFNAVFVFVIILIYLIFLEKKKTIKIIFSGRFLKWYMYAILTSLALSILIFFGTWPYMWGGVQRFLEIVNFYRAVGTNVIYQPLDYYWLGINFYPLVWILVTTPPVILLFSIVGLIFVREKIFNQKIYRLAMVWLMVTLARVMIPGASIYGGSRQIMEFIPALAIVAGISAKELAQKKAFVQILFIALFLWPVVEITKIFPNENVYMNFLIGGLGGGYERQIPAVGNSFGNAYKQGIEWLNKNAPYGAKVALVQGTPSNAPAFLFRSDIKYLVNNNVDSRETYFSGINREGEYLMELTHGDVEADFHYVWEYINTFLDPVYELKVQEVSILKIWKNDIAHTKQQYGLNEQEIVVKQEVLDNKKIVINLGGEYFVSRINLDSLCDNAFGYVESKRNNDLQWVRELDRFPQYQMYRKSNFDGKKLDYHFPGRLASYIQVEVQGGCSLNLTKATVLVLK